MRNILKALDERFPNLFRTHPTYPCIQPTEIDANEKLTNYRFFIFDYLDQQPGFTLEEEMHWAMSIDNLQRLGLIKLNSRVIQLNYDYTKTFHASYRARYCTAFRSRKSSLNKEL